MSDIADDLLPAKMSPDAYIQQALQLAWYRDQGCSTATYETASTRLFLHGRTDTIRTLTSDSRAFVKGMVENKVDVSRFSTNMVGTMKLTEEEG